MWFIIGFSVFALVAAIVAFVVGYRSYRPSGPKYRDYKCGSCGRAVHTTDNLGGKCDTCWADNFESQSERAWKE